MDVGAAGPQGSPCRPRSRAEAGWPDRRRRSRRRPAGPVAACGRSTRPAHRRPARTRRGRCPGPTCPCPSSGRTTSPLPASGRGRYRRAVATGDLGEFDVIERLRRMLPGPPLGETWIGDDAAVVAAPSAGPLLLAADTVVEGVHFRWQADPAPVGWKALAVNVSDIAAMGGRPVHALVTVAGPVHTDFDALYRGLAAAAAEYGCSIVGGDLSNADLLVMT